MEKEIILNQKQHDLNKETFEDVELASGLKLPVMTLEIHAGFADRKDIKTAMKDAMENYCTDLHAMAGLLIVWNTIARDYVLVEREHLRGNKKVKGILDNAIIKKAVKDFDAKKRKAK